MAAFELHKPRPPWLALGGDLAAFVRPFILVSYNVAGEAREKTTTGRLSQGRQLGRRGLENVAATAVARSSAHHNAESKVGPFPRARAYLEAQESHGGHGALAEAYDAHNSGGTHPLGADLGENPLPDLQQLEKACAGLVVPSLSEPAPVGAAVCKEWQDAGAGPALAGCIDVENIEIGSQGLGKHVALDTEDGSRAAGAV